MSMFRSKKLDLGGFVNIKVIRDHTKRKVFEQNETERLVEHMLPSSLLHSKLIECDYRQALRYIIRNTLLPQRARAQAQLQLSQMHCYTRPTQIKNRCIAGGKGRGVFRDFRMARVRLILDDKRAHESTILTSLLQYQFRMHALAGQLPGVKKASW
ncbi:unnamed protein product [Aureobasidium uvarum]|uniref:Ribosomal protein S14 n=1 Tax=Aureobasidium uvarum TaxID=2773716 RepID=A0A9N8PRC1_9PEZI|nr:unnamed protein product [Aureobasidium uvarum]